MRRLVCLLAFAVLAATGCRERPSPPRSAPPPPIGLSSVSPELGMDAPVAGARAAFQQSRSASAFDGSQYLVVWEDRRGGVSSDIYGARVSATGTVLDPYGIRISDAPGSQLLPAVAWDGTNFLVAWADYRNGDYDLYGARVSPSGAVLDPSGIAISTVPAEQSWVSLAFDGTSYLAVWIDYRNPTEDIYGARITPGGAVLDPSGIAISTAARSQWYPKVSAGGGNFFVVWEDTRGGTSDIYGSRVSPDGQVLDAAGIAISTDGKDQGSPSLAFNGTEYLVVWDDFRRGSTTDIYGARVTPAGAVVDAAGIQITSTAGFQLNPAVATNGTDFFVAWEDGRNGGYDLYGARVTGAGAVLDGNGIALSTAATDQSSPWVAFGGGNYLVSWEDARVGSSADVYATRVSTAGAVLDGSGIVLSTAANTQLTPAVAFDGTNSLVVWSDNRGTGDLNIYGARVTATGTVLDPSGIAISTAAGEQAQPAVAFDGTQYLVVWQDSRNGGLDIYGARVTPAGAVLEPAGIAITTATNDQYRPAVASSGNELLVVWKDHRTDTGSTLRGDIYGTRMSKAGAVLDPAGIPITTSTGVEDNPTVAFGGSVYLVAWNDSRNTAGTTRLDIYGARVTPAGAVLEPNGLQLSNGAMDELVPSLAFDGTQFLVVWQGDDRVDASPTYPRVRGARVTPAGVLVDTTPLDIGTVADSRAPSVSYDGTAFVAVWEDSRAGSGNVDLYGARIGSTGSVSGSFPLSTGADSEREPALASNAGTSVVVYQRFDPSSGYVTLRTRGRILTPGGGSLGDPCVSNSECGLGFCADGVCCDSACGGSASGDCQACSVATGAAIDGHCGPAHTGTPCRQASDLCDAVETCDGTSLVCPANAFQPPGTVCRGSTSPCDAAETCTGTSATCPPDAVANAGTVCREAAAPCDAAETCDGLTATCPPDGLAVRGTPCRPAAGLCDVTEVCDGLAATCPADGFAPATTPCRAIAGACDVAEACTGASAECPADGFLPRGSPGEPSCDPYACNGYQAGCSTLCRADGTCSSHLGVSCGCGSTQAGAWAMALAALGWLLRVRTPRAACRARRAGSACRSAGCGAAGPRAWRS